MDMFMVDEKEGNTLALLVAEERATRVALGTVVPRKTTGEWTCRRLAAWLREMGLEFVDITDMLDRWMEHAKSDEMWIED